MKRTICVLCALMLIILGTGCGKSGTTDAETEESEAFVVEVADPQAALDEIYKTCDTMGVSAADDQILQDKFFIDTAYLDEYYVNYADGRYGVCDVFILKPKQDNVLQVRESLEQIKLSRAKEFENYDIHNSYQIAQDAQIFEQGGYLIMLMLDDMDGARVIIDRYIPKN